MSVDQACKKLVHQCAISYQFFMTLKGVTGQCQLQGKARFKGLDESSEAQKVYIEVNTEILLNTNIFERVEKDVCMKREVLSNR